MLRYSSNQIVKLLIPYYLVSVNIIKTDEGKMISCSTSTRLQNIYMKKLMFATTFLFCTLSFGQDDPAAGEGGVRELDYMH